MPQLLVTDRSGVLHDFQGEENQTIMEALRDEGIDELLALCGGVCSCATCHVYVDAEFAARLPAMSEDEDALLDGCDNRDERSRLSCQIRLKDELSGLRLTVAEED